MALFKRGPSLRSNLKRPCYAEDSDGDGDTDSQLPSCSPPSAAKNRRTSSRLHASSGLNPSHTCRVRISYREDSSEESEEDNVPLLLQPPASSVTRASAVAAGSPQSPLRPSTRPKRKCPNYTEISSDDEDFENFQDKESSKKHRKNLAASASHATSSGNTARQHRRNMNVDVNGGDNTRIQKSRPSRPPRMAGGQRSSGSSRLRLRTDPVRQDRLKPLKDPRQQEVPSDGRTPKWDQLPFEVLVQILGHAADEIRSETFRADRLGKWLVGASRTCAGFRNPALVALYQRPPLMLLYQPHLLLSLLHQDQSNTILNYATQIKTLDLYANNTLAYTLPGRGLMDLGALICRLPALRDINITNEMDFAPYRRFGTKIKYHYTRSIFDALVQNSIKLRHWRWNATMLPTKDHLDIGEIHTSGSFRSLTHLTISNFSCVHRNDPQPRKLDLTRTSFAVLEPLQELRGVTLENCTSPNWFCLDELPANLETLIIKKAPDLNSEVLSGWLSTHGSNLKTLELSHNQSLNLCFLIGLRETCPKLQYLKMDLTYYNDHALYKDNEPDFLRLLTPHDMPTWPTTLEHLELLNLRQWHSDLADNFFRSLCECAHTMRYLRTIIIGASLSIGWKERAGFRGKWLGEIKRVFKKREPDPSPHLRSFKTFRECKKPLQPAGQESDEDEVVLADDDAAHPTYNNPSGLKRKVTPPDQPSRRSKRIKTNEEERAKRPSSSQSDDIGLSEENSDGQNGASGSWSTHAPRQGLCNVIDVRIDSLRPGEVQFREDDFMDSELSGDEDWTGDNDIDDDYAW